MSKPIDDYWFHPGPEFKKYCNLVAELWDDPKEKAKFLRNPKKYLKAKGFDFPRGFNVAVAVNSADMTLKNEPPGVILPFPQKPAKTSITRSRDSAALFSVCIGFKS
jgi:hypothetical protein